jgi:hypothetical protein
MQKGCACVHRKAAGAIVLRLLRFLRSAGRRPPIQGEAAHSIEGAEDDNAIPGESERLGRAKTARKDGAGGGVEQQHKRAESNS